MHRNGSRARTWWSGAAALLLAGCSLPSSRENLDAAASLVATQTRAPLAWKRDAAAEREARQRAEAMLVNGLTLEESVAVAFLVHPDVQVMLEQLEISRSQFVAAATPPNPVAIIGVREPGGALAAFYSGRNVTVGFLQNVIGLLNLPDRRAIARKDLERARLEAASRLAQYGARVAQAWLEYNAALRIEDLRTRSLAVVQTALGNLEAAQARARAGTPAPEPGSRDSGAVLLAQQRASLFSARSRLLRAGVDVATAREKLGQLLGMPGWHDDWKIEGSLPALPAADFDAATLETGALQKRLDLQADARSIEMRLRALAMQRRFRWLNQLDLGLFREKAIGGTAFTGPNAVVELPLFDQRQAKLLESDAQLRIAMRSLESAGVAARSEIRTHAEEMRLTRALVEHYLNAILPNQRAMAVALGTAGSPDDADRLRLRMDMLSAEEDQVAYLRDYWRARSALALSLGDWPVARIAD